MSDRTQAEGPGNAFGVIACGLYTYRMALDGSRFPTPPYYAVIFTARRTDGDNGYTSAAQQMLKLAAEQPGFLGVDSVRDGAELGITVSYWQDEESIAAWRRDAEHTLARNAGRERWYEAFEVQVAKVERSYHFTRPA